MIFLTGEIRIANKRDGFKNLESHEMKKLYFFSNTKLKFVEIKKFQLKFSILLIFLSLTVSFIIFSSYMILNEIINPDSDIQTLKFKNRELKSTLTVLLNRYKDFDEQLNRLADINNDLRLSANLQPYSIEDRDFGTGGSNQLNWVPKNMSDLDNVVDEINNYVEKISSKINFETNNYSQIEETLAINQKLYDAIPALKPVDANYGDRFGIRLHPILKIRRMHTGIDLLANTGTPVYAPGDGTVTFVGNRGGLGKCIIIDHGFGYTTLYGHLSTYKVKKRDTVKRGDLIALSGKSGLSTGPHLHYEIRHNGVALNPINFIYDDIALFDFKNEKY